MTWREMDLLPTPQSGADSHSGLDTFQSNFRVTQKEIPGKHCGARESGVHLLCSCLKKSYKLYKTLTQGQNLIDHRLLTFTLMFIQLVKNNNKITKQNLIKMLHIFGTNSFPPTLPTTETDQLIEQEVLPTSTHVIWGNLPSMTKSKRTAHTGSTLNNGSIFSFPPCTNQVHNHIEILLLLSFFFLKELTRDKNSGLKSKLLNP